MDHQSSIASGHSEISRGAGRTMKGILISHTIVFLLGVVAGKKIDADELERYRDIAKASNESSWKRKVIQAGAIIGTVGISSMFIMRKVRNFRSM